MSKLSKLLLRRYYKIFFFFISLLVIVAKLYPDDKKEIIQKQIDVVWNAMGDPEIWSKSIDGLVKYGEEAIPIIIKNLRKALKKKKYSQVALLLLTVLRDMKSKKSESMWIELLAHKNSDFRYIAATCLGNLGSQKAIPSLVKCLDDKKPFVVSSALTALSKLITQKTIIRKYIHQKLISRSPIVRESAIRCIGRCLLWEEKKVLLDIAKDKGWLYKERGVALWMIYDLLQAYPKRIEDEYLLELEKLLKDPYLFYITIEILKNYRSKKFLKKHIIPKLCSEYPPIREVAVILIGKLLWREEKWRLLKILKNSKELPSLKLQVEWSLKRLEACNKRSRNTDKPDEQRENDSLK